LALASFLNNLSAAVADGSVPSERSGTVSVDVLGRYGFERDVLHSRSPSNLHVTFRTVHRSKGLEADYIVVPGMIAGTYGFPRTIADVPVLDLAMPAPESFEHAEERRLLYVALTRARRQVTLITPLGRMSPFVVELLDDPHVTVTGDNNAPVEICSRCGQGTMVERNGKFGPFVGCSTFPACKHAGALQQRPTGVSRGNRRRRCPRYSHRRREDGFGDGLCRSGRGSPYGAGDPWMVTPSHNPRATSEHCDRCRHGANAVLTKATERDLTRPNRTNDEAREIPAQRNST